MTDWQTVAGLPHLRPGVVSPFTSDALVKPPVARGYGDDLAPQSAESWDTLNHLNICVAVGQEFGLERTTAQMLSIHGVGDIGKLLRVAGVTCA
jgi:hypothetical protein